MNIRFISFYTPQYLDQVNRLYLSLDKFHLPYHHYALACAGSWKANTNQKPSAILRAMEQFPDDLLVYVDADAEIVAHPMWLHGAPTLHGWAYAGYRHIHRQILTGTLVFWPNRLAKQLVLDWAETCRAHPEQPDQVSFEQVTFDKYHECRCDLPESYCHIFDYAGGTEPPVIVHHQASRIKRKADIYNQAKNIERFPGILDAH